MFQSLELLALNCLFFLSKATPGKRLEVQDLKLVWQSDFDVLLTWKLHPQSLAPECTFDVQEERIDGTDLHRDEKEMYLNRSLIMEGGHLNFSVTAKCGSKSRPVKIQVKFPDLVKNLECFKSKKAYVMCTWLPVASNETSNLRFYYRLSEPFRDFWTPVQECPSYHYTDGVRTACNLTASDPTINIVFNATVNNTLARNTFKEESFKAKPPPLTWNVKETEEGFNVSWVPPEVEMSEWTFKINSTSCNSSKVFEVTEQSYEIKRRAGCPHCFWITAESEDGKTPPSDTKCFGAVLPGTADPGPTETKASVLLYVVPLLIVLVAGVTILCFFRIKEKLFPQVLAPRDLLSDILDNNNESPLLKLYTPMTEEEDCSVIVVKDKPLQ